MIVGILRLSTALCRFMLTKPIREAAAGCARLAALCREWPCRAMRLFRECLTGDQPCVPWLEAVARCIKRGGLGISAVWRS